MIMSAEKIRRINAAVSTGARDDEFVDNEGSMPDLEAVDDLIQEQVVGEPANRLGQIPLDQSLELWRDSREVLR